MATYNTPVRSRSRSQWCTSKASSRYTNTPQTARLEAAPFTVKSPYALTDRTEKGINQAYPHTRDYAAPQ
jgi:hypothetical protein